MSSPGAGDPHLLHCPADCRLHCLRFSPLVTSPCWTEKWGRGDKQFKLLSLHTYSPLPPVPDGLTPSTSAGGNGRLDQLSLLPEQMPEDGQCLLLPAHSVFTDDFNSKRGREPLWREWEEGPHPCISMETDVPLIS